jgi:hypothetical protein
VHDRRSALVAEINRQVPARLLPGGREMTTNGRSSSLATIALDCGLAWVPLSLRAFAPGDG